MSYATKVKVIKPDHFVLWINKKHLTQSDDLRVSAIKHTINILKYFQKYILYLKTYSSTKLLSTMK